jgi:hypothetical protein
VPLRLRAAVVVPIGAALALMIGVTATASAGTDPISGSARGSAKESTRESTQGSGAQAVTRLLDVPFADPGHYVEGRDRYVYATGHDGTGGNAFRVARYDETTGRYAAPQPSMMQRPRWVGPRGSRRDHGEIHMWGPHVWKRSVRGPLDYVMYFSASRRGGTDCVGMAVADSPLGPFVPRRRPLKCGGPGVTLIDPAYFRTGTGVHYLLYKRHRLRPKQVGIWAVRVRADGRRMPGARAFRIVDGQGRQIEAPSVVTRRGRTYLFASRMAYDSCAYQTVVYVAGSLRRPFRRLGSIDLRRPNGRRFCGPGGAEVVRVGARFRMVFHAFDKNPARHPGPVGRFAWGAPLRWTPKGRPYPAPARTPAPARFVEVPLEEVPSATVSRSTDSGSSRLLP